MLGWIVSSVSFSPPPLLVFTLASHLLHAIREDTVVGQSVAYATDNGGVMVGGYSTEPDTEWMMVSGITSREGMPKC